MGPTSPHSEKKLRNNMNPDVDSYTKTRNQRKTLRKMQKTTTYWKPTEYQTLKYKLSWDPVFTLSLPRVRFEPLSITPLHRAHIWICKKRERIGWVMMRNVAISRKRNTLSVNNNKINFSLWVFHFDVQDALLFLISLRTTKRDLPSF